MSHFNQINNSLDTIVRVHGTERLREMIEEFGFDPEVPENRPSPGVVPWTSEEEA